MRKVILMVALMLMSGSAVAEWVEYESSSDGTTMYLGDKIRRGDLVTMPILFDFPDATSHGFPSSKAIYQYDCKNNRSRTVDRYYYSEHMGAGKLETSEHTADAQWQNENSSNPLLKKACGIK